MEVEQSSEPRLTSHASHHVYDRRARDNAMVNALVIPFTVIVRDVLRHSSSEMTMAERHLPVQPFFFDRPEEALRVGVRIGAR
jgi:hypothetical protein